MALLNGGGGGSSGSGNATSSSFTPSSDFLNSSPPSASTGGSTPRPFADIGKGNVNLFGFNYAAGRDLPKPEGGDTPLVQGEAFKGIPVLNQVSNLVGGIANLPAFALSIPDRIAAGRAWADNPGAARDRYAFAIEHNQIEQGQAEAQFRRDLYYERHGNDRPNLFSDLAVPNTDYSLGGQVLGGVNIAQQAISRPFIRAVGNVFDPAGWGDPEGRRLATLMAATDDQLNYGGGPGGHPELIDIRDKLKNGEITRDEAFDSLIVVGMGQSNPTDFIHSLALGAVSDPTIFMSAGVGLFAKGMEQAATIGVRALAKEAGAEVTSAFSKRLALEAGTDTNFLTQALHDATMLPHLEAAMKNVNPLQRWLILDGEKVLRTGQVINNVLDPFSFFGRDAAGKMTQKVFSNKAAQGIINGYGGGVVRSLRAKITTQFGEEIGALFDAGHDTAGSQMVAQVGVAQSIMHVRRTRSLDVLGDNITESANKRAKALGGDISGEVKALVERTQRRFVPRKAGAEGVKEMMASARASAARQIVNLSDGKVEAEVAQKFVEGLSEKELSLLDFQHYGKAVTDMIAARKADGGAAFAQLDRVTLIGPRQITKASLKQLKKAIKVGDIATVRGMVDQYDDLYRLFPSDLTDEELLKRVRGTLSQLKGHAPQTFEDLSVLPENLRAWGERYGAMGYKVGLRPTDDMLARPIYDEAGMIIGVNPWVDLVDEKIARVTVNRAQALQRQLFSNISGASVLRDARYRFVRLGAERYGLPAAQLEGLFQKVSREASNAQTTVQGLTNDEMYRFAMGAGTTRLAKDLASKIPERQFAELMLEAYSGSLSVVGWSQKFTGSAKVASALLTGANGIGVLANRLYPLLRFKYNPFFQFQELWETPFFMLLRGRIPMADFKRVWTQSGRKEMADEIDRTLWVMGQMQDHGTEFIRGDIAELSTLTAHTNRAVNEALYRSPVLKRIGEKAIPDIGRMKEWGVARSFQYEQKNALAASMKAASPESWTNYATWLNARVGSKSDLDAVTNFAFDAYAKADPDTAFSKFGAQMFTPAHLGPRNAISRDLVKSLVYGEQKGRDTKWGTLLKDVREGKESVGDLEHGLRTMGADPVYIQRVVDLVTMPEPDEFYAKLAALGRTPEEIKAVRQERQAIARLMGVGEHEALSRIYAAAPASLDHLGDVRPGTYFQLLSESLIERGYKIVDDADPLLREVTPAQWLDMELPDQWQSMRIADLTPAQRKARSYQMAAQRVEANPNLGKAHDPSVPTTRQDQSALRALEDENGMVLPGKEAEHTALQLDIEARSAGPTNTGTPEFEALRREMNGLPPLPVEAKGTTLNEVRDNMGIQRVAWDEAPKPAQTGLYDTTVPEGLRSPVRHLSKDLNSMTTVEVAENKMGNFVVIPGTEEPIKYLYRAVSEEDWQNIQATGVLKSDGRMNLTADEGTVASPRDPSWYLPDPLATKTDAAHGRIVRIKFDPADGWKRNKSDGYLKTDAEIPLDRIDMVSPKITNLSSGGASVINAEAPTPAGLVPKKFVIARKGGKQVHRLGEPTGEEWFQMLTNNMTEQQLKENSRWYLDTRKSLLALANNDPEEARRLLLLFGVSQLNTSPKAGMLNVFRSLAKYAQDGELPVNKSLSGLNAAAIARLITEGKVVEEGLGQKLIDFVDSLLGKRERTAGYHGPDPEHPWGPVAGDIWAKRDLGYLDPKMSEHLGYAYGGKAVWDPKIGFTVTTGTGETFVIPKEHVSGGVPSDAEYHQIVRFYNERATEANAMGDHGFMGRQDWTAADMQALGWFRAKLAMGDSTGTPLDAIHGNVVNVHTEVMPARGTELAEIYPGQRTPTHVVDREGNQRGRIVSPAERKRLVARGKELLARERPARPMDHLNVPKNRRETVGKLRTEVNKPWGGATYDPRTGAFLAADPVYHGTLPSAGRGIERGGMRAGANWTPREAEAEGYALARGPVYRTRQAVAGQQRGGAEDITVGSFVDRRQLEVRQSDGRFAPLDEEGYALGGPYSTAVGQTTSVPLGKTGTLSAAEFKTAFDEFVAANEEMLQREGTYIGVFNNVDTGTMDFDVNVLTHNQQDAEALQAAAGRKSGAYDFWSGDGVFAPVGRTVEDGLPGDQALHITTDVGEHLSHVGEELLGIRVMGRYDGVGVAGGALNPNAAHEVISSFADARAYARVNAYLTGNGSTITREAPASAKADASKNLYHAVDWHLDGDTGGTWDQASEALRRLKERSPMARLDARVVRYDDGTYGVRSVWRGPKGAKGTVSLTEFKKAHPDASLPAQDVRGGVSFKPNRKIVEHEEVSGTPDEMIQWLRSNGYESVAERVSGPVRDRMGTVVERAYRKHAAGTVDRWRANRATLDPTWEQRAGPLLSARDDLANLDSGADPAGADAALNNGPVVSGGAARSAGPAPDPGAVDPRTVAQPLADRPHGTRGPLFQRVPRGTAAAITFDESSARRASLYLNPKKAKPDTLLHEEAHRFAEQALDPSGRKAVLDAYNLDMGRAPARYTGPARADKAQHAADTATYEEARTAYDDAVKAQKAADDAYIEQTRLYKAAQDLKKAAPDAPSPAAAIAQKWRDKETRNSAAVEKDLTKIEGEFDTGDAMDALDTYRNMVRSDFSDAEEYATEREAAWNDVLDAIDSIDDSGPSALPDLATAQATEAAARKVIADLPETPNLRDYGLDEAGQQAYSDARLAWAKRQQAASRDLKAAVQDRLAAAKTAPVDAPVKPVHADLGEPPVPPEPLPARIKAAPPVATTSWTEAVHEWFAKQMVEFVRTGEAPAPHLVPIFNFYKKYLTEVTDKVKMSPETRAVFADVLKTPPGSVVSRAHPDEIALMDIMQGEASRSARNAYDLTHFRTNRSWLERSLNHPYFGMYPISYMWGKVLPELLQFLVAKPFGLNAPMASYAAVGQVYRAIMLQQAYDPELRKYMKNNEPAMRALAMFVPGLPWDLPVNAPLWLRRIAEGVSTQQQRVLDGKMNPDGTPAQVDLTKIDVFKIASDTAGYALNPTKGPGDIVKTIGGLVGGAQAIKSVALGEPLPNSKPPAPETPALTTENTSVAPTAAPPVKSGSALERELSGAATDLTSALGG